MARTFRKAGMHGETKGNDGNGAFKHWTRNDCESFRCFWDPEYDRKNDCAIIDEEIDDDEITE